MTRTTKKYIVSRGNSIGWYSDYIPQNIHETVKSATDWGADNYYDTGFTVWYFDEDGNPVTAGND